MAALEKQIENHKNGVKVLEDQRLKSLKTRMNSYKTQIFESSRGLSPQVCYVMLCLFYFILFYFILFYFIIFLYSTVLRDFKKKKENGLSYDYVPRFSRFS
jgi:hypothetical protein